jgi:23S rRNA pseudouridine1911/1915/1917 synthase
MTPAEPVESKDFSIRVSEKGRKTRFDQFLSQSNLGISRSQAKRLIEAQQIFLNGQPAKPSTHLKTGDLVSGRLPEPEPLSLEPEPISLSILYEDSSIVVIDKPPGMVVHPAVGNVSGTLVNALVYHCRDLGGINGVLRPGIVHRLDKDTSGVIVVAKNDESYHSLVRQFKNREVDKTYLAIACGAFTKDEGIIDAEIGRHRTERKRMSTRTGKGRAAITRWKVIERLGAFALLEIFPRTGRTHQIRVHLSFIGHPILGDPLYGRKSRPEAIRDALLRESVERMRRQALHAHRLAFTHPRTGERVEFVSPVPEDMNSVLTWLRANKSAVKGSVDE